MFAFKAKFYLYILQLGKRLLLNAQYSEYLAKRFLFTNARMIIF